MSADPANPPQLDSLLGQSQHQFQSNNQVMSRSISQPRIRSNIHEQNFKNSLSQQLSQQISLKTLMKRNDKLQTINVQKQLVKSNDYIRSMETNKEKTFFNNYKSEAMHNFQLKQMRKYLELQKKEIQKQMIDRQYKQGHEAIERKRHGFQNSRTTFNLPQIDFDRITALNPEQGFLTKSSHYKISNKELQQRKDNLRQTLIDQMRSKTNARNEQKQRILNTPFIEEKFKGLINNPITNPINVRVAKDNPYIMKQWVDNQPLQGGRYNLGSRDTVTEKLSYLSRRGSSSLLTGNY